MQKTALSALFVLMILALSIGIVGFSLSSENPQAALTAQNYTYTVINTYPHDPNAFTEGLFYADGFLYESTGLKGFSSLRRVDLASGEVLQEFSLSDQFFGEGAALVGDAIIQLTYQEKVGFVYDKTSFALIKNFSYPTEGWGLTFDGENLIMSDGSSNLYFIDPETFQQVKALQIYDGNVSVSRLNELEYINGDVYANIYEQTKIAVINPNTGQVKVWVDLTGLQGAAANSGVLNGIAYGSEGDRLFVTGKNWRQIYEIKLAPNS
ncbi:MAG: glutaminyl-peptide cyclotransferase [Candidatus Bathyarchaeota archaeon]|nr:glutaminyl-peptide cyclotransferase [Candidatus Bathyarchaeota archaeon]